ncbi:MAG: translation initiation factor eIF-2B [Candidatus Pacearchaeota archaeon]|nr:translation initiation factor eIF-2B [Candidatus Pacearchaeota archaeon]
MSMKKLKKIYSDIKNIKIQGASNIAKAAIRAYLMKPDKENKKKIISLRPTEPMLVNSIKFLERFGKEHVLNHFEEAQEKINKNVCKIIKEKNIIYTHCHSTNVVKALIYAKKKGKKFEVYNTETRPLYQGRLTSKELAKNGIRVTEWVDAAMDDAITNADMVLLGADAILEDGIINKIGSEAIAEIAFLKKKPVYIVADSWKFSPKNVKIEERDFKEVWEKAPKKIKIRNPAFEKVNKKYIKKIISELGILRFNEFVKRVKKNLDF